MREIKNKKRYLKIAWNKHVELRSKGRELRTKAAKLWYNYRDGTEIWNEGTKLIDKATEFWVKALFRCHVKIDWYNRICIVDDITYKW